MKVEFLFDILFQMCVLYLIFDVYQKIFRITISIRRLLFVSFVGSYCIRNCFIFFYNNNLYFGICVFLILTLALYLINLKEFKQIIYYSTIVTTLIFYMYMLINFWISVQEFILTSLLFSKFLYALLLTVLVIYIFVFVLKLKFLLPTGKISVIIIFTTIALLIFELLFFDQLETMTLNNCLYIVFYVIIALFFFSSNIIIQYLYNDFHQLTVSSQNNFLSKITDSYIHGIQKEQEKVYKIRHDIKNNIIILQHLINNDQIDDANKILNEINQNLKYKKSEVYTGNIFIDAYLTNIINSSQLDIEMKCSDLKDLHYKPDILAIIINLVDNAVENALHNVTIHIKYDNKNSILMKVSNDCEKDPSKHLKKSKKQGDHGYGLRIVKDTINQYHGTYLTSYQNGVFTTYVMLKLGEDNEK